MPYLLLTPSTLFWRRNDALRHHVVQGANPVLGTVVNWALNAVMLYQRHICNVKSPLLRQLLISSLQVQSHSVDLQPIFAPGKTIYMAAISLIVLIINRLISLMRPSLRYNREMQSRTVRELLYLSHRNLSRGLLLNRFSFQEISIMKSAMVLAVYCSLLRNILLTGSQRCHLLSWLFILNGIGACSFAKTQRPVDK
ncbi:TPA: hypothetical protein M9Z52_004946 [Klebsiella variicola subsp. variicola]|uniref:hypothetical protein n=1 Tax=Klebsiella pneumoniae complex TaxID=3390273 RepID=UPI000668CD51|nr:MULTISPECIES: hypothetical protein [Klebsiella]MCQ0885159.1 hypothetical protein [Klebsiella pneumoniae]HCD1366800.1 hypothetical protein [Klebsiella variicola subsp. variicola]